MDQICQLERQPCPLDNISASIQSLETVRALHQTVVSLRTALEDAQKEIEQLKKQILVHADIDQGRIYRQQHQLEHDATKQFRKQEFLLDISSDDKYLDKHFTPIQVHTKTTTEEPISEPTPSFIDTTTNSIEIGNKKETETKTILDSVHFKGETDIIEIEKTTKSTEELKSKTPRTPSKQQQQKSSFRKYNENELPQPSPSSSTRLPRTTVLKPEIKIITDTSSINRKHKQMASKIDVKIKVSSNVKLNESSSDTQTDTNSGSESARDSEQSQSEDGRSPRETDENPNVLIKSTENLTVEHHDDQKVAITKSSTENICVDNLSIASLSEGENSVFEDDTNANTNESNRTREKHRSENQEEVDDIELIFSSDDKEFPQEDLVSISEYEPWAKAGSSGTPVLVNFTDIHSDQENAKHQKNNQEEDTAMDSNTFFNAIQSTIDQNTSADTSMKSSNFEKENSQDNQDDQFVRREESFDTFDQQNSSGSGLGRRWTNLNVLIETDISKCGIAEENILDLGRRNTCPNPPPYRPIIHREAMSQVRHMPTTQCCPMASKFSRRTRTQQYAGSGARSPRPILMENSKIGPKRSSSAQTEISALPEHWRSESHLAGGRFTSGLCTLPSKFIPPPGISCYQYPSLRIADRTQEVRRALLSDINFTSMVPELSRSADHLCQEEDQINKSNESLKKGYYKGTHLQTPDYCRRGITPSFSMTSPGVSQWTVNENSFGTQTTQTENYWGVHGDSFDSSKSYSMSSKYSNTLDKSHRSRSVPSIRCAICKQNHGLGIRASESMHYTPRVTFQEPNQGVRGSLPDLRKECTCSARRYGRSMLRILGDSSGSTESLLDEADDFLRKSMDVLASQDDLFGKRPASSGGVNARRCSENDIKKDYIPSKQSLPFLPKSPKCLKPGHLAKVITKNGRVAIGRVRYIGPLAFNDDNETFVGLQLPNNIGDCDGSIDGRKFFDCEPQHGTFVPFKKIVMAWTA